MKGNREWTSLEPRSAVNYRSAQAMAYARPRHRERWSWPRT
jgi:hypothetical protein